MAGKHAPVSVSADPFKDRLISQTERPTHDRTVSFAPETGKVKRLACLVTHGMGQQVPFETIADLTEAFRRGPREVTFSADRVQLEADADLLSCMRLQFAATEDQEAVGVDVFEGYWAPLTEGKISLAKTLTELFLAGYKGLLACVQKVQIDEGKKVRGKFTRWVFGEVQGFSIKRYTAAYLFLAILVIGIMAGITYSGGLILHHFWNALRVIPAPHIQRGGGIPSNFVSTLGDISRYALQFIGIIATNWVSVVAGAILVFLGYWIRYFLVEFAGDVIIYVSSYKVSAYQEIRDAIQKRVLNVGKQIVTAKDEDGTYLYDGLIFVGHSLGSVVTYDLVNALLVWDATGCEGVHKVRDRIHRLITFGSPLDKTAFLFRMQIKQDHHYREAMAGAMQPLILSYEMRPFPWVNLYSPWDPVCGRLAYYDLPAGISPKPGDAIGVVNPVENIRDRQANVFGKAHLQYWDNDLLTQQLMAALQPPTTAKQKDLAFAGTESR